MPFVATLLAPPSNPILVTQLAQTIAKRLDVSGLYWLADGIACDLALKDGSNLDKCAEIIKLAIDGKPIDFAIQDVETRRKSILIADMDSTMIDQECIDELAAEVGLKEKVSGITARAMNGEIEFDAALRERVGLLAGLPVGVIDDVIANRITLKSGGKTLIATMKKSGAYCALVSGGFTVFTQKIADIIGFDENRANVLLEDKGVLSGEVADPILGMQAKVDALIEISDRLNVTPEQAIAVGDGANDLGMLGVAGSGVALHAKPSVAAQAKIRIDHCDLTALLYLQGYRKSDFVGT